MNANQRRNEIMRILLARRQETMGKLAKELKVTERTIRNDIYILTSEYPLITIRGNGGGVKLEDWYHPNKHILSKRQQEVLFQMLRKADSYEAPTLKEIINLFCVGK